MDKIIRKGGMKLVISLFVAIILWTMAMDVKNPERNMTFVEIPVQLTDTGNNGPSDMGLEVIDGQNETVTVTVRGRRKTLLALDPAKVIAKVDLTGITESGVYPLQVEATVADADISVVGVTPKTIEVMVDEVESKKLPVRVQLEGNVPKGAVQEKIELSTSTVEVTGPKSEVEKLGYAEVVVTMDNETSDLTTEAVPQLKDMYGNVIASQYITSDTEKLTATVPVMPTKTVPLVATTSGTMPDGYQLKSMQLDPTEITVAGNQETLDHLESIQLPVVDVTGLTESKEVEVAIEMPEGVYNLTDKDSCKIQLEVEQNSDTQSMSTGWQRQEAILMEWAWSRRMM